MARAAPSVEKADSTPIRQLYERVGKARAADLMGVDGNNFKRWFDEGKARLAFVLAAKYCLSQMDREANSLAIAVVVVPAAQRAGFDHVVKAMNLDTKYVVR